MNKYSKNFILLGDLNYHCLLCKESYQTEEDLERHIRWENHRKIVKGLSPLPKFKADRIFKIDEKYFCEHCNQLFSKIAEVKKHIEDENHQKLKTDPEVELRPSLCKRESGLTVIGKDRDIIKIPNKEWYGVDDSKCVLCDVPVDHFVKHISLADHMITLIQSKIIKNEEGLYYREFKNKSGYCFLCKTTFELQSKNDHWKEELHMEKAKEHNEKNTKTDHQKKLEVAIKLINTQKDFFDIDLENKVATCKICTAYVNINFKYMIEHKKIHNITDKDKVEQATVDMEEVYKSLKVKQSEKDFYDHGRLRSELAKFGKKHFIKMIFPGSKGFCLICGTYMSAHMKKFTEHVGGQIHMGHLEIRGLDKSVRPHVKHAYKTKNLVEFVKSIIHLKEVLYFCVNREIYVDIFSFMLVSEIKDPHSRKFICYACDIMYDFDKDKNHWESEEHAKNLHRAEIVTTIKDGLIREVHPNLFHCAVCNLMFPFWEMLQKHLQSWKHIVARSERYSMLSGPLAERVIASMGQEGLLGIMGKLGLTNAFSKNY